jgi:hypothetical protein
VSAPLDAAVLELLLEYHPGLLTLEEVVRHVTAGEESFHQRDAVEVAVRELVKSGLAHRLDRFVLASVAAVAAKTVGTS